LGRLLCDGALRDALARAPAETVERVGLAEPVRAAVLALNCDDLEFQARILLRKRFQAVLPLLPATAAALADKAWPLFLGFGRTAAPSGKPPELHDANGFLQILFRSSPNLVVHSEANRIRFAFKRQRFACYFSRALLVRNRCRCGLQLFLRQNANCYREYALYFGF